MSGKGDQSTGQPIPSSAGLSGATQSNTGQSWGRSSQVNLSAVRARPAFGAARKGRLAKMKRTDGLKRLSRAIGIDSSAEHDSPIFAAVRAGDLAALLAALGQGKEDIDATDELGGSALHLACKMGGGGELVKVLLKAGAAPSIVDYRGSSPLHIACRYGSWASCTALLDHEMERRRVSESRKRQQEARGEAEKKAAGQGGAAEGEAEKEVVDVNVTDVSGASPLFLLMRHNSGTIGKEKEAVAEYRSILEAFCSLGGHFHGRDHVGSTLVHQAAISNNVTALDFLLGTIELEIDVPDHSRQTPLLRAIGVRAAAAMELLLAYGADVLYVADPKKGRTAFDLAKDMGLVTEKVIEAKECIASNRDPAWAKRSCKQLPPPVGITSPSSSTLTKSFDLLLELAKEHWTVTEKPQNAGNSGRKLLSRDAALKVRNIVKELVEHQYGTSADPQDICWGHVFHKRLVQQGIILTTLAIDQLTRLLDHYIEKQVTRSAPDLLTLGMRDYMRTHQQDPDNSLLGIMPDPALVAESGVDLIVLYNALERVADNLFADDEDADAEHLGSYTGGFPAVESLPGFKAILKSLEFCMDDAEVLKTSRALGTILRQGELLAKAWEERQSRLDPGDLLITLTKNGDHLTYAFTRFSGRRFGKYNLEVFTIPEELMTFRAHVSVVLPISAKMLRLLGELSSMMKLVDDPVDKLCRKMLAVMRNRHTEVLKEKGVDVGLLHRVVAMTCKLAESKHLPRLKAQLEHQMDHFQEEFEDFFVAMRQYSDSMFTLYKTKSEYLDTSFFPARSKDQEILHLPVEYITRKRMACYVSQCDAALARAREQKLEIVEGVQKRKITDWWRELINKRCEEFLAAAGFHTGAISADYLEEEPEDLAAVRENVALLQAVLAAEDTLDRQGLVNELKAAIYPRIDEYIASAEFTVADLLGVTQGTFSLNFCNMMFSSSGTQFGPDTSSYVTTMMNDLQYLYELKAVEADAESHQSPNVIPVSGLTLDVFRRLLIEHQTALEQWTRRRHETIGSAVESIGRMSIRPGTSLPITTYSREPAMDICLRQSLPMSAKSLDQELEDLLVQAEHEYEEVATTGEMAEGKDGKEGEEDGREQMKSDEKGGKEEKNEDKREEEEKIEKEKAGVHLAEDAAAEEPKKEERLAGTEASRLISTEDLEGMLEGPGREASVAVVEEEEVLPEEPLFVLDADDEDAGDSGQQKELAAEADGPTKAADESMSEEPSKAGVKEADGDGGRTSEDENEESKAAEPELGSSWRMASLTSTGQGSSWKKARVRMA